MDEWDRMHREHRDRMEHLSGLMIAVLGVSTLVGAATAVVVTLMLKMA